MRHRDRLFELLLIVCVSLGGGAGCNGSKSSRSSTQTKRLHASPGLSAQAACIDGDNAMAHIRAILAFGERHAGTEGLEDTRQYIVSHLTAQKLKPVRHPFVAHTPHPEIASVTLANIVVDIPGKGDQVVVVSGHFDGKIIENGRFQGANDGGSSTGLLLEMARCLTAHPLDIPVRLVFFDGEEALVEWSDSDSLYGSKNYVASLRASGEIENIAALINIDMVADPRLLFFRDTHSTPWIYDILQRHAQRLNMGDLFFGPTARIEDDHLPFVEAGIPAAVLIDLAFGPGWTSNAYWHTPQDNLDNISANSMTQTGQIVLSALPHVHAHAVSIRRPPAGPKKNAPKHHL